MATTSSRLGASARTTSVVVVLDKSRLSEIVKERLDRAGVRYTVERPTAKTAQQLYRHLPTIRIPAEGKIYEGFHAILHLFLPRFET